MIWFWFWWWWVWIDVGVDGLGWWRCWFRWHRFRFVRCVLIAPRVHYVRTVLLLFKGTVAGWIIVVPHLHDIDIWVVGGNRNLEPAITRVSLVDTHVEGGVVVLHEDRAQEPCVLVGNHAPEECKVALVRTITYIVARNQQVRVLDWYMVIHQLGWVIKRKEKVIRSWDRDLVAGPIESAEVSLAITPNRLVQVDCCQFFDDNGKFLVRHVDIGKLRGYLEVSKASICAV